MEELMRVCPVSDLCSFTKFKTLVIHQQLRRLKLGPDIILLTNNVRFVD